MKFGGQNVKLIIKLVVSDKRSFSDFWEYTVNVTGTVRPPANDSVHTEIKPSRTRV